MFGVPVIFYNPFSKDRTMEQQPILTTERLKLRPFTLADATDVQRLAGHRLIASTTLRIPHPYTDGIAEKWIETHRRDFEEGKGVNFAITRSPHNFIIGSIGLIIDTDHNNAELGYWIGKPYWNQGYATEAARHVVKYAFEVLNLNRVHAHHFACNPQSGRVMKNIPLIREGALKQHIKKWEQYEDIVIYGITKNDWKKAT